MHNLPYKGGGDKNLHDTLTKYLTLPDEPSKMHPEQ